MGSHLTPAELGALLTRWRPTGCEVVVGPHRMLPDGYEGVAIEVGKHRARIHLADAPEKSSYHLFVYFHEVAHVRLGHVAFRRVMPEAVIREYEAERFAEWVFRIEGLHLPRHVLEVARRRLCEQIMEAKSLDPSYQPPGRIARWARYKGDTDER